MRKGESILNKDERFRTGKKVSITALIVNTTLASIKITVGLLAHSRAMIADGIHSASDSVSTIIVLFSLKIAATPPDSSHPYGHERSETLAANLLALSLIISGLVIAKDNIMSIVKQSFFYPGFINIWAGIFSIFAQEGISRYSIYIGRKINSPAIIADAMHHRSDAISSIAAVIGIIAARNGILILDPIAGLIVAGMIIHIGVKILMETFHELMEGSPDSIYLTKIKNIAQSIPGVQNITDVKVRKHANSEIIEMTITVHEKLSVFEGDKIAHNVEDQIITELSDHQIKEVHIHVDPHPEPLKSMDLCHRE
ncbi:MAG: cation transporter [Halanaerobiales bacterium]|nr:cation transporter [Halanaerobiales bacterium]